MKIFQKNFALESKPRGFHLITQEIETVISTELKEIKTGICQIFIQHTSAALTINENADYTVRKDFESHFNEMVPENAPYYLHDYEGSDDMPAHIKSSLLGASVMIPIKNGKFALGTWQGIYLCEHRNYGGRRHCVATLWGEQ